MKRSIEDTSVVFIGAGNLATNLAKALYYKGFRIVQVYSRTEESARTLAQAVEAAYTTDLSSVAVDQLEEITRQTLSDTDYSIDSAKLEVRTGIVARKELESTDALEENLTRQLGLVDYAYVLYVEGEPVAATTFPGAIEQLLEQLKKGYITDSTVDCYFVENVEVKQEYVDQSLIMNLGYIAEKLNATIAPSPFPGSSAVFSLFYHSFLRQETLYRSPAARFPEKCLNHRDNFHAP